MNTDPLEASNFRAGEVQVVEFEQDLADLLGCVSPSLRFFDVAHQVAWQHMQARTSSISPACWETAAAARMLHCCMKQKAFIGSSDGAELVLYVYKEPLCLTLS